MNYKIINLIKYTLGLPIMILISLCATPIILFFIATSDELNIDNIIGDIKTLWTPMR